MARAAEATSSAVGRQIGRISSSASADPTPATSRSAAPKSPDRRPPDETGRTRAVALDERARTKFIAAATRARSHPPADGLRAHRSAGSTMKMPAGRLERAERVTQPAPTSAPATHVPREGALLITSFGRARSSSRARCWIADHEPRCQARRSSRSLDTRGRVELVRQAALSPRCRCPREVAVQTRASEARDLRRPRYRSGVAEQVSASARPREQTTPL